MESPGERLGRLLVGISLALFLITALAMLDGRLIASGVGVDASMDNPLALIVAVLAIVTAAFALLLILAKDWPHGSLLLDKWFSREEEGVMRLRLEEELEESSIANLGTGWARMEMEHLESKHGEEE
ncbi:MAG: hypothetical protein VX502_01090 [Candidatus Thermoplasmatota archaeon]|nr:hypothetical protein [Candidatus Thermoplasmatota archaeon]